MCIGSGRRGARVDSWTVLVDPMVSVDCAAGVATGQDDTTAASCGPLGSTCIVRRQAVCGVSGVAVDASRWRYRSGWGKYYPPYRFGAVRWLTTGAGRVALNAGTRQQLLCDRPKQRTLLHRAPARALVLLVGTVAALATAVATTGHFLAGAVTTG